MVKAQHQQPPLGDHSRKHHHRKHSMMCYTAAALANPIRYPFHELRRHITTTPTSTSASTYPSASVARTILPRPSGPFSSHVPTTTKPDPTFPHTRRREISPPICVFILMQYPVGSRSMCVDLLQRGPSQPNPSSRYNLAHAPSRRYHLPPLHRRFSHPTPLSPLLLSTPTPLSPATTSSLLSPATTSHLLLPATYYLPLVYPRSHLPPR